MNWNEIKKDYPKSFDLLDKAVDIHWELEPERYQRLRFLYDFFDEQGIYISINVNMFMMFDWSIITTPNISISIQSDFDYNLRIEAEEQAFLKAFEILEDRI